jgi:predicted outer membrane repeat protein
MPAVTVGGRVVKLTFMLLAVLFALAVVSSAAPAASATFTVNSRGDGVDRKPGDGRCSTAAGKCTLRAAVMEANARSGGDRITLRAGKVVLGISGTSEEAGRTGDIDVTDALTIRGAGSRKTIVDGHSLDRIFDVIAPASLSLSRVTLQHGNATKGDRGGALHSNKDTVVVIENAVIKQNKASVCNHNNTPVGGDDRFCGDGGGIATLGTTRLTRVTFVGNQSVSGSGGGLVNDGLLTMNRVTLRGNKGGTSAGGLMNGAKADLHNAIFEGNSAPYGGGIAFGGVNEGLGVLNISDSTFTGNRASSFGGAIAAGGRFFGGPVTITNSTFAGNTAASAGGAIATDVGSTLLITNATFSGNSAVIGGGLALGTKAGTATVANTILAAGKSGGNCVSLGGTFVSSGSNLSSDMSCRFGSTGDVNGKSPNLAPLRMNRPGSTKTQALRPGSPAIDAVLGACPARDQRGIRRPQDGNKDGRVGCDIGAFEVASSG